MQLGEYLDKDLILADLESTTKADVLHEIVGHICRKHSHLDPDDIFRVLMDREQLGTTGIGDGIAIPHGKLESLDKIIVAVGRSSKGIDYDALDFAPCRIFFLVFAPEQVAGLHLRVLAHVSRLLKDENFRNSFLEAEDMDALWTLLKRA